MRNNKKIEGKEQSKKMVKKRLIYNAKEMTEGKCGKKMEERKRTYILCKENSTGFIKVGDTIINDTNY